MISENIDGDEQVSRSQKVFISHSSRNKDAALSSDELPMIQVQLWRPKRIDRWRGLGWLQLAFGLLIFAAFCPFTLPFPGSILVAGCLAYGAKRSIDFGRRLRHSDIADVLLKDQRPPILILRDFGEDSRELPLVTFDLSANGPVLNLFLVLFGPSAYHRHYDPLRPIV